MGKEGVVFMKYLKYLIKQDNILTDDGEIVEVYELSDNIDPTSFDEWANHFRNQYCPDGMIDMLVSGTGLTKEEYLLQTIFPDESKDFGPATRSGDFAELLVSDYLEFILGYIVPRERYKKKYNKNNSTQGTDIIALKMLSEKHSSNDEFLTFEVKAQASGGAPKNRLQDAVNDSYKDAIRKGESLNALKHIYLEKQDFDNAKMIERFQNKPDRPYVEKQGAAAIHTTDTFSESLIKKVKIKDKIWMIVIKKNNLMNLIHELYRRAAQC